jgi:hypothetical protein
VPIAMSLPGQPPSARRVLLSRESPPRIVDLGDFRLAGIRQPTGTIRATSPWRPSCSVGGINRSQAGHGAAPAQKPGPPIIKPGARIR